MDLYQINIQYVQNIFFHCFVRKYLFLVILVQYLHSYKWYLFYADAQCKYDYTCPRPYRLHTPMSFTLIGTEISE